MPRVMNVLDLPFVNKLTPVRKGAAFALQIPRYLRRLNSTPDDFESNPPVIVNSIPKSGTHLLMQIARALPRTRYYGSFLAQQPSLTLRRRGQREIDAGLARLVPGEVIGTHLHYTPETASLLRQVNAVHLMIIRDPIDVLLSEAHYLRSMARFHRMHREFKGLDEGQARQLALAGSGPSRDIFPAFPERIKPYAGWLDDPDCCVVRFEQFALTAERRKAVETIVEFWAGRIHLQKPGELEGIVEHCIAAIDPARSHTTSTRKREKPDTGDFGQEEIDGLRSMLHY